MDLTSGDSISILGITFDNPVTDTFNRRFIKNVDKGTRKEAFIIPLYSYRYNSSDNVVCWGYDLRVGKMGGCELDGKRVSDKAEIEMCRSIVSLIGLKYS